MVDAGIQGKAMVFGATGFTGRAVVAELLARGVPVVAHVRPDSQRLGEWRERFSKLGAEVDAAAWEEQALAAALSLHRPAYVFGCLGTTRKRMKKVAAQGRDPQTQGYEAVDYGLTVMVLDAAKAAGLRPRFVYISAVGGAKPGMSAYSKWRYRTEQAVIKSGVPYNIARPSFIMGPGRDEARPNEILGARLLDGCLQLLVLVGLRKYRDRLRSTTNQVLARNLVRVALEPGAQNQIFESEQLRE